MLIHLQYMEVTAFSDVLLHAGIFCELHGIF